MARDRRNLMSASSQQFVFVFGQYSRSRRRAELPIEQSRPKVWPECRRPCVSVALPQVFLVSLANSMTAASLAHQTYRTLRLRMAAAIFIVASLPALIANRGYLDEDSATTLRSAQNDGWGSRSAQNDGWGSRSAQNDGWGSRSAQNDGWGSRSARNDGWGLRSAKMRAQA